jgi:hypothetical protein
MQEEPKVVGEVVTGSGPVWDTHLEQCRQLLGWTDLPWEILLKIMDDLSLSDILHVQQVQINLVSFLRKDSLLVYEKIRRFVQ